MSCPERSRAPASDPQAAARRRRRRCRSPTPRRPGTTRSPALPRRRRAARSGRRLPGRHTARRRPARGAGRAAKPTQRPPREQQAPSAHGPAPRPSRPTARKRARPRPACARAARCTAPPTHRRGRQPPRPSMPSRRRRRARCMPAPSAPTGRRRAHACGGRPNARQEGSCPSFSQAGRAPNRRSRRANSAKASLNSAGPKSGHSTSRNTNSA